MMTPFHGIHGLYRFLTVLSCFLFALPSCKMADTGMGSVRGRIVQSGTGDVMEGVMVVYGDSSVFSDANGEYLYENIPENMQGLRFVANGFETLLQQVNIVRNQTVVCDVQMELITTGWAVGSIDSEYGTILHSTDRGVNWIRRGSQSSIPSSDLTDVCAVSSDACWIVGEKDNFGNTSVILKTTDGGTTWTNQGRSLSSIPPVSLSAIFAIDEDTAWTVAADTCLILNTRNGGTAWSVCHESAMMQYYTGITSVDGIHIWCCGKSVSGGAAVEYSSDGGQTWNFTNIPNTSQLQVAMDICAVDSSSVYLVCSNAAGAFKSEDGGVTWTSISNLVTGTNLSSIDVLDANRIFVTEDGGNVYMTTDGFSTLSLIRAAGNDYTSGITTSINFLRDKNSGAMSVLSPSGSTGVIYYTTDGGLTWSRSITPYDFAINSVDFVGGYN